MITTKGIELLQYRVQQEELSSRIYEQMSLWLNNEGYVKCAGVWKVYSTEELKHAEWAKEHLLSYGILPALKTLAAPETNYKSLVDIIDATYEHEVLVTKQCNELAGEALKMNDHVLYSLATKYCAEQREELDKAQTLKDLIKTFGSSKEALLLLDDKIANL